MNPLEEELSAAASAGDLYAIYLCVSALRYTGVSYAEIFDIAKKDAHNLTRAEWDLLLEKALAL